MNSKKVIIIGAGIAGLSAGCYLQMNGYDTEIFEAHGLPGGLCTSWKRKDYTVEGCIHGLLGSSPSHPFYRLWSELIDMEKLQFIDQEIKEIYDFGNGEQFSEYADLNRLEHEMMRIAPEDKNVIGEFIKDIRRFQKAEMPVEEVSGPAGLLKLLKMVPLIFVINKWINVSAQAFSGRFKNPFLQKVVRHFSSPILFEMFVLSEMDLKRCGYPASGSLAFSRLFEKKYLSCGGKINYNRKVARIIVQGGKAVGIELENGEIRDADIVISASDGRKTIFEMLQGQFVDKTILSAYEKPDLNPSRIQVALGLNRVFDGLPRTVKLIFDPPLAVNDGSRYDSMDVMIYNDTKELSPEGKTLLVVQLETRNDKFWTSLKNEDVSRYKAEKRLISEKIIELLDQRLGGIRDAVEMTDVATPATYIRYTGNWRGSIQGWANENLFKRNPFKKELPGLSGFYLAGQWVEPGGGIPAVFRSGRDLSKLICKKDGKKFKTT